MGRIKKFFGLEKETRDNGLQYVGYSDALTFGVMVNRYS